MGVPYGKECRSLFVAPAGYKLVGIDVSGLEKAPDLNKEQKTALQNYKAAKSEYERLTIGATGTDQTEAQERAGNRVREAQRGLLKAFPGIRFSE